MEQLTHNPFQLTKAVDFTDEQINSYWVDYPVEGGFKKIIPPSSPMPMFILGGKGCGKTHLMRYFSYNSQKIRHGKSLSQGITTDKYLGIYLRCSGLNSSRFTGKGQSNEVWSALFNYYIELSLSQLLVNIMSDINETNLISPEIETDIVSAICQLMPSDVVPTMSKFMDIEKFFNDTRKSLDHQINNCVFTNKIDANILSSNGVLIFGIPQIISNKVKIFSDITFSYFLDEFENFNTEQQKYINTLVREKEPPTSFKIGSRLYGMRTRETFSAEEELKKGSEYDEVVLDHYFRENEKSPFYKEFVSNLCLKRLSDSQFLVCNNTQKNACFSIFDSYFEKYSSENYFYDQTKYILEKYSDKEKPYFKKLTSTLKQILPNNIQDKHAQTKAFEEIEQNLWCREHPLLEKINIFMLYQDIYAGLDPIESSKKIKENCLTFLESNRQERYSTVYKQWHSDLLAQLLVETEKKISYSGFENLVRMSCGLPRPLLITLKFIYKWSLFNSEIPFSHDKLSIRSQQQGIREAAEWFLEDALPVGLTGNKIRVIINRLGELFRTLRFSDKPSEVSVIAFSTDTGILNETTRELLDIVLKSSLMIQIKSGRKDKNSKRIDYVYQLNPILAPKWDLPISRRGILALPPDDVDSIFDDSSSNKFQRVISKYESRMQAPFFGKKSGDAKTSMSQLTLG